MLTKMRTFDIVVMKFVLVYMRHSFTSSKAEKQCMSPKLDCKCKVCSCGPIYSHV